MGAEGFHGRVRNGVGWVTLAMITKPSDQGDRMAWLSWILGHPIMNDRFAWVFGPSGRACQGECRIEARLCVDLASVLARFVWSNGHGVGSFLEEGEFYRAIRIG